MTQNMSKNFSQQEENFWPCVSDMFLALFIIALTLYAMKERSGEGDLKVQEELIQETCAMLNELDTAFPQEGFGKWTIEIRKEHLDEQDEIGSTLSNIKDCKNSCSLCQALVSIREKYEVQKIFEKGEEPDENIQTHRDAIQCLYKYVKGKEGTKDDLSLIREAHQEISFKLIKSKQESIRLLENTTDNGELHKILTREIENLKKKVRETQERLKNLTQKNEGLVSELEKSKESGKKLEKINQKLEEKLGEDVRPVIMKKVASKFMELERQKMVQIEKDEGVIRIPSETLKFKKGAQQREDQVLEETPGNKANRRKIADALYEFMEEDQKEHLVDTIVIEGHASKEGNKWANDLVSTQRAIGTWIRLNGHHNFEKYKNGVGKMIIGYAGFGSHNLLEKEPSESEKQYDDRCRRIDIRFIPAAVRK